MTIPAIKAAVSLPELIGEYVKLRSIGTEHIGSCPFHQEKTPSLRVHADYFKCFGCGAGGDCFTFLAKIENVSIGGAMHLLSIRTGIPLDGKPRTRVQRAYDAQEREFSEWWQKTMVSKLGKQLTAYCRYATEDDCERVGALLRGVRQAKGVELRALAARAGNRAEWVEDVKDAEMWTWFAVESLCLS